MKYLYGLTIALVAAAPVAAQDMPLSQILIDGEGWKKIDHKFQAITGLTTDKEGQLYVYDWLAKEILRLNRDGKAEVVRKLDRQLKSPIAFGPDGSLYMVGSRTKNLVVEKIDGKGEMREFASLVLTQYPTENPTALLVRTSGDVLLLTQFGLFLRFGPDGKLKSRHRFKEPVLGPGLVLSPDQGTLVCGDSRNPKLWVFRIDAKGTCSYPERYYTLQRKTDLKEAAQVLTVDRQGRVYAVTALGIQVFDPTGRLCGVMRLPASVPVKGPSHPGQGLLDAIEEEMLPVVHLAFGGPNHDLLFASYGKTLYVRKLKAQGVAWPEKKPAPKDK
jgi:enterochelin esterase family protein